MAVEAKNIKKMSASDLVDLKWAMGYLAINSMNLPVQLNGSEVFTSSCSVD